MVETRGGKQTDSGFKATGEFRGSVKQSTTRVKDGAEKLNEQAKVAAEERRKKLTETRQLHTPKAGSKSVPTSPSGKPNLDDLPGGLTPETYTKQLLGQHTGDALVVGVSKCPSAFSAGLGSATVQ